MNFSELGLQQELLKAIEEIGYTETTPIQEQSIPLILEGRDVIGRSQTGTGKTAAFGLPAISRMTGSKNVEVLILCPTRELAMQASEEIAKFSRHMQWVKPCAVYGGASIVNQIQALKRGANIVVGTPGRVMDHIARRTLKLDNVQTVILDEADEMLNMGFREDIEEILKSVPEERQTVLFSATMPPAIMAITKSFQKDPVVVKVEAVSKTVEAIEQYFYEVPTGRKADALMMLLSMYDPKRSIVFCNTKKMVDELVSSLGAKGFKVMGIHGDMKQQQRTQVMDGFKAGRTTILIATDVAARGIDVDDVDAVFNYDIPQDYEYYIHRIGRTGRAGRTGVSFTLTSGRQQFYEMKDIQRYVKAEIKQGNLPSVEDIRRSKMKKLGEKIIKTAEEIEFSEYSEMIEDIIKQGSSIEGGFTEHELCCTLLSIQAAKEVKAIKSIPEIVTTRPKRNDKSPRAARGAQAKLFISAGKRQRMAPNFILGALVEITGLQGSSFGKIEIFENHTTVEIPETEKDLIISTMNGGKINGVNVAARLYEQDSFQSLRQGGKPRARSGGDKSRYDKKPYGRAQGGYSKRKSGYSGGKAYSSNRSGD